MDNEMKKKLPGLWLKPQGDNVSLMDRLVQRFSVMYPNATSTFFSTPEQTKAWCEIWAECFAEHEFTPENIKYGLEQCVTLEQFFMPNLPQFIKLCTPPVIPMSHRDFLPLDHKPTPEGREAGLELLKIFTQKFF